MTSFSEKKFGEVRHTIFKNLLNPVGLGSLGIGVAGLKIAKENREENKRLRRESDANSKKQLEAMDRLTTALTGVEESMKHYQPGDLKHQESSRKKEMRRDDSEIRIRLPKFLRRKTSSQEKSFTSPTLDNIIQKTWNGAMIGAGIGTMSGAYNGWVDNSKKSHRDRFEDAFGVIKTTTLIGAGLGLLVGIVQGVDHMISGRNTYSGNIADDIRSKLKSSGYVEDKDYTLNPKFANILKTRACLVVSRTSDDLKLLVNTVNDPELKKVTDEVVRGLPRTAVVTENLKNRFNELSISTLSKGANDTAFVTRVAEMFIKRGMPVYIVEVG